MKELAYEFKLSLSPNIPNMLQLLAINKENKDKSFNTGFIIQDLSLKEILDFINISIEQIMETIIASKHSLLLDKEVYAEN